MSEKDMLDALDRRMLNMNDRGGEFGILRKALRGIDRTRLIDEIRQVEMSAEGLYQKYLALLSKIGDKRHGKYVEASVETLKVQCDDLSKDIIKLTSYVEALHRR